MTQPLADLAEALLAAARVAGAEAADAMVVRSAAVSIDVRAGRLEHAERSEGMDLGLRVLIGRRQACVSASDLRPQTLTTMAERAVAMAREAPEDATAGLADPSQLSVRRDAQGLMLCDPAPPAGQRQPRAAITASPRSIRPALDMADTKCIWLPPTALPAGMNAVLARSLVWRSPATAPGWSVTGPPNRAFGRQICRRRRPLAIWPPNEPLHVPVPESHQRGPIRWFMMNVLRPH